MKRKITGMMMVFLMMGLSLAQAAPERILIKKTEKATKERQAKAQIKNIDLEDIEDPAAKQAIGAILNYLNLQSKK